MNPGHLRKNIFVGTLAITVLVGLYVMNRHRDMSPSLRVTSTEHPLAPEFSLQELTGKTLKLSDYRGKVVLLDFWATWCDPCREQIPYFVELQNKLGDQGFQIIGVSMDDGPEPVRDFYRKFRMNYPVVMGNAQIGELYGGVLGLPIAFVIGRDGRIYSKHIGATDISLFNRKDPVWQISEHLKLNRFYLPSPARSGTSRPFATSRL